MEKNKICLIAVLVIATFITLGHAQTDIKSVPNIEGISEGDAIKTLERGGFLSNFSNCFSNTEKYFVIPGTQEPRANMSYVAGREIKAAVSLGQIPVVIGLGEDEAKARLIELHLLSNVVMGRNNSVIEGVVYDQYPKDITCMPVGSKVNIFVNRFISIDKPHEGDKVGDNIAVRGRISSNLTDNEHLWIAVKPDTDVNNWWPQINADGPIEPMGSSFEGNAFLGGVNNDGFQIGILVIDDKLNQKFLEWKNISKTNNTWPPITEGYPNENIKVSKKDIEDHVAARVNVTLDI